MAENKKSFIAYCDWGEIFDELSDEEAGKLVKHLFNYVRDEKAKSKDKLTNLMFIQIKQSLKRDLEKYDKYIDKQRDNGKKGGRPKNSKEPKEPKPFLGNPTEPKKADSVSVSVNDSVNDILLKKETKKFSFIDSLLKYGFKQYLVSDWMRVRKTKKATNTETAFKGFIKEIEKQDCDINEILKIIIEKDWKGFKWEWLEKEKSSAKKESGKSDIRLALEQADRVKKIFELKTHE